MRQVQQQAKESHSSEGIVLRPKCGKYLPWGRGGVLSSTLPALGSFLDSTAQGGVLPQAPSESQETHNTHAYPTLSCFR